MSYFTQKVSIKDSIKILFVTLICTICFASTFKYLVLFYFEPKNFEFLLKFLPGFVLIPFFPKFYRVTILTVIFFFAGLGCLIMIGSDYLNALEFFTDPILSKEEYLIQEGFAVTYFFISGAFYILSRKI